MSNIGKLERVPLRDIWIHEARDFNAWLEENIDILSESLGLSLSSVEREKSAGAFSADLVAEDDRLGRAIIECQLEKTNHDHLGKVLTYLTNLEAKIAIWVCSEPCQEHVNTLTWLNEVMPDDIFLYLVKVEGVRIENSPPAALFSVICGPSEELKKYGEEKKVLAERHKKRLSFWEGLLTKSKIKTKLHGNISPQKENWIGMGAGKSGLSYNYFILMNAGGVELYIDKGKEMEETNLKIFDNLFAKKNEIETEFGGPLMWQRLEDRRACRIKYIIQEAGLKDEEKWDELQDQMINKMIKLDQALKKHIKEIGAAEIGSVTRAEI
jgi:hypothetical protein